MTMDFETGKDGFWARVRASLGRRANDEPAYGRPAIARTPGRRLRAEPGVDDALRQGWALAAQRQVSLCVMALEIDRHDDYFGAYGRDAAEECLDTLHGVIAGLLPHDTDRCLRWGRAGLLLVLPDTPRLMGRELAGRIVGAVRRAGLANKESHAGVVTLGMGLAVVNPQGPMDPAILDAARQALARAARRGLARLEIADLRAAGEPRRSVA